MMLIFYALPGLIYGYCRFFIKFTYSLAECRKDAVSNFIPHDERVITIEDSAELQIAGIDNLVSLETRNANASGSGAITIRDLIKSSLRMRPDTPHNKKGKIKALKKESLHSKYTPAPLLGQSHFVLQQKNHPVR